jgi:AraC-like DNA-binding protein
VPEVLSNFSAAGQIARQKLPGFQVRLGLLGLQTLTHVVWRASLPGSESQRNERLVQEAQRLLASNLAHPLSPERIAKELHVGYSFFRRLFKTQTGFSPKQYRLQIRFRRACDFLRNTDLTIKEISQELGYDSPYHLSTDFRKRQRASPTVWRESHRACSPHQTAPAPQGKKRVKKYELKSVLTKRSERNKKNQKNRRRPHQIKY